jgi:hypothetical protein
MGSLDMILTKIVFLISCALDGRRLSHFLKMTDMRDVLCPAWLAFSGALIVLVFYNRVRVLKKSALECI